MRPGWRRAVAMGLALLLVQACATVPHEGRGGSSSPGHASFPGEATFVSARRSTPVSGEEWRGEAGARRAEMEGALAHMWAQASGEQRVGAELEFTFWVERGALTLLSQRRRAGGGERGQAARAEAFTEGLRGLLTTLAERRVGALAFTLRRERRGWRVDYEAASQEEPPEARRRPARRKGYPEETLPERGVKGLFGGASSNLGNEPSPPRAAAAARTLVAARIDLARNSRPSWPSLLATCGAPPTSSATPSTRRTLGIEVKS
jgi:hypothetical protein